MSVAEQLADLRSGVYLGRIGHYRTDEDLPLLFFGGRFSSFAVMPIKCEPLFLPSAPLGYPTREHWFAAHKTRSLTEHKAISFAPSPQAAKEHGRRVQLQPGWDDGISFAVMVEGIRRQAATYEAFAEQLVATGQRLIAEDSPSDFVWGIRDKGGGYTGRNLLGRALMRVRGELQRGHGLEAADGE
jgi:ribA/ribD-fused uncharacterized protein